MAKLFSRLETPSNELLYLDVLRIIASMAIVVFHFRVHYSWPGVDLFQRLDALSLAVDLFFVISGFVIAFVYDGRINSFADYRDFFRKRLARLVPLHWATLLVFIAIGATVWSGLLHSDFPENYDRACIVPNIFLTHAFGTCHGLSFNYVSWSISAEIGMYLLFPVLAIMARTPLTGVLTVVAMIVALTLVGPHFGLRPWYDWTFDFGVLRAIPEFTMGIVCFRCRGVLAKLPKARLLLLLTGLLFVVGMTLQADRRLLLAVIYLAGIFGIAASLQGGGALARALAPYGQLTYSIYMLHPLMEIVLIGVVGQRLLHLQGAALNVLILLAVVATIPVGYASLVLFETPARRWITRLKLKPRLSPAALKETVAGD